MRESVLRKVAAQAFFSNPKEARGLRPGGDHEIPVAENFYPAEPDEAGASRD